MSTPTQDPGSLAAFFGTLAGDVERIREPFQLAAKAEAARPQLREIRGHLVSIAKAAASMLEAIDAELPREPGDEYDDLVELFLGGPTEHPLAVLGPGGDFLTAILPCSRCPGTFMAEAGTTRSLCDACLQLHPNAPGTPGGAPQGPARLLSPPSPPPRGTPAAGACSSQAGV